MLRRILRQIVNLSVQASWMARRALCAARIIGHLRAGSLCPPQP